MKMFRSAFVLLFLGLASSLSVALEIKPYAVADFAAAQQAGKRVALHFHADWCPTCLAQQKAILELRKQPGIDVTIFVAKYDDEEALRKKHRVMTQSTLIVFKGYQETGRIAGVTSPAAIAEVLGTSR